jgi:Tol biopolymer transport system component
MPSISPDGTKVVYLSIRPGTGLDLWVQPLRGGQPSGAPSRLIEQEGVQSHPVFSPDGRWIACYRLLRNKREIWIMPVSGERPVQLTHDPPPALHPAWSHDGSAIAFAAMTGARYEIWAAPVENGRPFGPVRKVASGEFSAVAPAWSPDKSTIAFVDLKNDEYGDVWLVPGDGGAPARKLTNGAGARRVRWDAETRDLLVSGSWSGGGVTLRRVSPQTGLSSPFSPEVDFGGAPSNGLFDISPDGKWLVVSSEDVVGHVWLLNSTRGRF